MLVMIAGDGQPKDLIRGRIEENMKKGVLEIILCFVCVCVYGELLVCV